MAHIRCIFSRKEPRRHLTITSPPGAKGAILPAVIERALRVLRTSAGALVVDFGNPDMGRLGIATAAAAFSTWCFTIALGVYGFEAHGAAGVGIVALVRFLPAAIVSPLVGLLIDRFPRRSVLLASAAASTAVLGAAAAAAALGAPTAVVFAFPALFAVASCGFRPAHAALTPTLVESPQQLSASNVTHSVMENAGSLVAALVAGLLLGRTSPAFVIAVAAAGSLAVTALVFTVRRDSRPEYLGEDDEVAGAFREITVGARTLFAHPALRLSSATLVLLFLFEGFADVLVVVMALELLGLGFGSVGFLNATWGVGAVLGGMALAMLLDRGRLVLAIAGGSLLVGLATMLPGIVPEPAPAYAGWLGIGVGFVFVEVAAKTLMQRLGSDETLGRVIGSLEAGRQGRWRSGRSAPSFWSSCLKCGVPCSPSAPCCRSSSSSGGRRLRAYEVGAPVEEAHYMLLRATRSSRRCPSRHWSDSATISFRSSCRPARM